MVYSAIMTKHYHELTVAYKNYIDCQSEGISPLKPHCYEQLREIQTHSLPGLVVTAFLLLGAAPVVNLMFVLNWKLIKEKLFICAILICKIMPNAKKSEQVQDFST